MTKFFKILGYIVLSILLIGYLGFLFILPNAIDLNVYKPDLQKIVKQQTNLDINFKGVKIITTPLLGAGVKIDDISVKLPDGSLLMSADRIKTRIAIPSLFVMTVKISCLDIDNPFINLEIANDNTEYKIVKLVEDILNTQKAKTFAEERTVEEGVFKFNPEWIRIKIPCVCLNNYKVLITDLNTKHYLDLHGEKFTAGYFNGKIAKLKTYAELFSDTNKNISADIDINTFLPKPQPGLDAEDDPAERIDIPFVNPVEIYRKYDLKANIDTKLRVRYNHGNLTSFGHVNIDNITMKISHLTLPEAYLRVKSFDNTLDLDTNIYAAPEQNLQLLGKLNYSKHPKMDMYIKTGTIKFNDLLILGKAFLDSLQIKNELNQFKADGSLIADCYIKTNFKKLKSNGFIKISNGGLAIRNLGQFLSKANVNVVLDNNVLNINDSSLYINNSKVNIDGNIDKNSIADIKVNIQKLPLTALFYALAPRELRRGYNFQSGDLTLDLNINGKLKEAISTAKFDASNLNISDTKRIFNLKNQSLSGEFMYSAKNSNFDGNIENKNFALTLLQTGSTLLADKLGIVVANKNITILENFVKLNNNSQIKYSGEILDYIKLDKINFIAEGSVNTDDLIKLIGREYKMYISSRGNIPVKVTLNGNKKKQTLLAQALADNDNYITPIEFTELGGKNTALQSVIDFKPNRMKIKKTGLFTRTVTLDDEGNEIINLDKIIDLDGTIAGDNINLLKINIDKNLSGKIHVFPHSSFMLSKSRMFAFGPLSLPILRGSIDLRELRIPELLTSIDGINLNLRGHDLDFSLNNILLNGSDISTSGVLSLLPSDLINITNLDIRSRLINLDKILKVADLSQKYAPPAPASKPAAQPADIPVVLTNGTINMHRILTGNIEVLNTTSRMTLSRNILALRNLRTNIFKGNVAGDIDVNLLNSHVDVDLKGENIDVAKAMLDATGMKDMLSGTAKFDAILSIDGSATTPEAQMKGINGNINFSVKEGQYGPFGKIENLIIAENIRQSQFFQTALGGVINSLTQIDTTHFDELKGHLVMQGGICHIDPITSLGNILTLHIFGDFDLIKNYADMKVRAKMSSVISNLLGPISAINPINLVNSAASLNVVTAKAFSIFCEVVPQEEFDVIPSLSNAYVDNSAMKFQLGVRGDAAKPLTLVKSFKWLASKEQYEKAEEFANSLPEVIEGSESETIEQAIAEAKALEEEKKTLKYKVKHVFAKDKK